MNKVDKNHFRILIDIDFMNIGLCSSGRVLTADTNDSDNFAVMKVTLPEGKWKITHMEKPPFTKGSRLVVCSKETE